MKRALVLGVVVFLGACSEGPVTLPPPPPAPVKIAVAQLSGLKGQTFVTRGGARAAATPGSVFEGDVLETGPDGHALLSAKGREVELLENSHFRVGATLADLALSLGELIFEESDGGEFATAAGAARTGAGSKVRLQAHDGGTSFVVGLGTLELLDVVDGGSSTVKAGERFVVGLGVLTLDDLPTPQPPPQVLKPKLIAVYFGINAVGPFQMSRAAAKHMGAGSAIVNVSSIAGQTGSGSSFPYVLSKAALNALTLGLARTLAPGIRVNAVLPGMVEGRWMRDGLGDAAYERVKAQFADTALLGTVCTPQQIASTIVWLLDADCMMTGQLVVVDAGFSLGRPPSAVGAR